MIERFLDDLNSRIDESVEEELEALWRKFWDDPEPSGYFHPARIRTAPPRVEWPRILINHAFKSPELMLLREMAQNSQIIADGNGQVLNIRSNYGTGILPSLFGADTFFLDDEHDTLPGARPFEDPQTAIRRLLDAGVPDLNRGWLPQVFETAEYYRETLRNYPRLQRFVAIYHPDLQGPADVAELLYGSEIFMAVYDEPDLVKALLDLIAETYCLVLERWEKAFPTPPGELHSHWNWKHRGVICLRDDSAMNFSPDMYSEFILPYDQRILKRCGGGVVHFCGRGDHYIDQLTACDGITGIQLSQPEYNDMEKIYFNTVDRGIRLLNLPRTEAEKAVSAGRELHGLVHCS